jgi:signal transduction histidine kinase
LGLAFAAVLLFYELTLNLDVSESEKSQHFFAAIMFGTFILTQTVLISTVHGVASNRLKRIAKNNKRLLVLTEQLSLANEHKEKFLSSVSHEMRTPLNVIHGYLDLLRARADLPSEAREHISHVHGASTHMLSLINDLLDYSQIRQGQFTMAIQPVELPALIQQIFMALNPQAEKKQLAYTYETSSTLPNWEKQIRHKREKITDLISY